MLRGWRYRIVAVIGAVSLTAGAVLAANHPLSQSLFTTHVPLFDRLEVTVLEGTSLHWAVTLSVLAVGGSLIPLYKPRPRRVLDTVFLAQKRVLAGGFALATLGYFQWSHRLPRATLVMTVGVLGVAIPAWFVWIQRRPTGEPNRTLVVGDDAAQIRAVVPAIASPVTGYLCPSVVGTGADADTVDGAAVAPDGAGAVFADAPDDLERIEATIDRHGRLGGLERLGGLSRIEDVLVEHDVDTVVLAFRRADRAEFFGTLDACHEHGVAAKVHREYADSVLVSEGAVGDLVAVDLEPWDPQDHLFKRAFDVAFAVAGLVALAPLMAVIAVAIKLDSSGPLLYGHDRTAVFGEPFPVYKFRSMVADAESDTGATISDEDAGGVDPRVTRVGRVVRKTHLDEIPQLWSILVGDMSVVGPRPERPELDSEIQRDGVEWEKRWFVKPGLTGLAQINGVTGHEPTRKLRYDLEYVRRQSFFFDVKIVIRQIWTVLGDVYATIRGRTPAE